MGKIKTSLFGYSKKEVDALVSQMDSALETAEKNVDYLSRRVAELEAFCHKNQKRGELPSSNLKIEKNVASSIQKSLEIEREQ